MMKRFIYSVASISLFILTWELTVLAKLAPDPKLFPSIFSIFSQGFSANSWPSIPLDIAITLYRAIAGLSFATLLMVPLGLLLGNLPTLRALSLPIIELFRPLAPIALIPVASLFLGIDDTMKIFVVFFGASWPILINTLSGATNIDPRTKDLGLVLPLTRQKRAYHFLFAPAIPSIITGIRISIPISLIVAVASDMIIGSDGIGRFILDASRAFLYEEMYLGIFALMITGGLINYLYLQAIEKPLMERFG